MKFGLISTTCSHQVVAQVMSLVSGIFYTVNGGLATVASLIGIPLSEFALATGEVSFGLSEYAFGAVRKQLQLDVKTFRP